MDDFSVSPRKHRQRSQRIDYHLLNDGSTRKQCQKTASSKKICSNRAPSSVEILIPDDSSSPADSSQQPESTDDTGRHIQRLLRIRIFAEENAESIFMGPHIFPSLAREYRKQTP
ncbi:hypothetical protein V1504DRAFT_437032 [Lipomyces starkeyi]